MSKVFLSIIFVFLSSYHAAASSAVQCRVLIHVREFAGVTYDDQKPKNSYKVDIKSSEMLGGHSWSCPENGGSNIIIQTEDNLTLDATVSMIYSGGDGMTPNGPVSYENWVLEESYNRHQEELKKEYENFQEERKK